jgi:hypothetical protein
MNKARYSIFNAKHCKERKNLFGNFRLAVNTTVNLRFKTAKQLTVSTPPQSRFSFERPIRLLKVFETAETLP